MGRAAALAPALWPRPRSSRISRPGADRAPSGACSRCPATALRLAWWGLCATAAALPALSGQLNAGGAHDRMLIDVRLAATSGGNNHLHRIAERSTMIDKALWDIGEAVAEARKLTRISKQAAGRAADFIAAD